MRWVVQTRGRDSYRTDCSPRPGDRMPHTISPHALVSVRPLAPARPVHMLSRRALTRIDGALISNYTRVPATPQRGIIMPFSLAACIRPPASPDTHSHIDPPTESRGLSDGGRNYPLRWVQLGRRYTDAQRTPMQRGAIQRTETRTSACAVQHRERAAEVRAGALQREA